tara:strand:- start:27640 stop:28605 length:966 start_codon:yes stop_codon:yes gene_type:complete
MIEAIIRRLFHTIIVLLVVSIIIFAGIYVVGNPIDLLISPTATQQDIEDAIKALGLDKPLWNQYFDFLINALNGDLGKSFIFNIPAIELILSKLPATLELAFFALFLAIVIGLPLGLIAGLKSGTLIDRVIMTGSILGFSVPTFWLGVTMIMFFSVYLGWLPPGGRGPTQEFLGMEVSFLNLDGLKYILLPGINLALFKISLVARLARSGTKEALLQDYVKFARAKGLSNNRIVVVHVLKNILIPIVTVMGMELGSLIAYAMVTETIFNWPGSGKLIIDSIYLLDRPVIVAYLLIITSIIIFINLLVDLIYSFLDPRVRIE